MPAAFILQCVFSCTMLVAAATCIGVGARPRHDRRPGDALWLLTGAALVFFATAALVQNVFGGIALAAGNTSPAMRAYLRWDPLMNHSRTFLMDALMALLAVAALRRRALDRPFWIMAAAVLMSGFAVGMALGGHEGRFSETGHYSAVAVWDVAELMMVFTALFTLLLSNAADRFLWSFISAYGVSLALSVFWLVVFAQRGVPGSWSPPAWTLPAMRLACYVAMAGLALAALLRRRRGETLPGMLGPRARMVASLH